MTYRPHHTEQLFVLEHVARISELGVESELVSAILAGAGEFAAGEWAPLLREGDTNGPRWTDEGVHMPPKLAAAYRAYVAAGWGTIGGPEHFGGQGLPFVVAAASWENFGTANLGLALAPLLTTGTIEALLHHGSDEQKQAYLPKLVSGEWTGTMNLTEPQAGSDVGAVRARAVPRGDGSWSVSGSKIFISFGDHDMADNIIHLILARTPGAPEGSRGLSMFIVPKYRLDENGDPGQPNGVRVDAIEHKLGLHASPTCVLSFGAEEESIGWSIGDEFGGMRAMFTMMNNARLNVGLQGVQVAEGATQKAIAYASERIQGSRRGKMVAIIEHPDVRRMLLRMKAQTQAARALVYLALREVDRAKAGKPGAQARLDLLTPLAKAHATDVGCEVAHIGIQVHGGMGYIEETGAAQFLRDALILPIYEGTNGIQAADLVMRKLTFDDGEAFRSLLAEMRTEAGDASLVSLINMCEAIATELRTASADDRLAGATAFLTMLATAVCGWLMERQLRIAETDATQSFMRTKTTVARFYLDRILPEAIGLESAAMAGAASLYAVSAQCLAE
jgi:alkylation response protein AidB-like acyl-CoA dehydrogenase